jgi:protein associated with RNAse G/E
MSADSLLTAKPGRLVRVTSTKYDGSAHWDFDSWEVRSQGTLLITSNFAGQELGNWKGSWTTPWDTCNHFWSDRWYNVMRCDKPNGDGIDHWYCNVTTPAEFEGQTIRYVDLDLDLSVSAAGDWTVLDEDEFLENAGRMGYPPHVVDKARRALEELIKLASSGEFPFQR